MTIECIKKLQAIKQPFINKVLKTPLPGEVAMPKTTRFTLCKRILHIRTLTHLVFFHSNCPF